MWRKKGENDALIVALYIEDLVIMSSNGRWIEDLVIMSSNGRF